MKTNKTLVATVALLSFAPEYAQKTILAVIAMLVVVPAFAQTAARPEDVMANNDLNKDGVITREEAIKAGKTLAQYWDYFDLNKDGKVDMDELKKVLAAAPPASAPAPPAPAAAK